MSVVEYILIGLLLIGTSIIALNVTITFLTTKIGTWDITWGQAIFIAILLAFVGGGEETYRRRRR